MRTEAVKSSSIHPIEAAMSLVDFVVRCFLALTLIAVVSMSVARETREAYAYGPFDIGIICYIGLRSLTRRGSRP